MKRFDGRVDLTLAAYNAGEETVEAYLTGQSIQVENRIINPARRITGGIPPYLETRKYVAAGLGILAGFERTSKFEASQRQEKKGRADEETSQPQMKKSRSIVYVVPPDQAYSTRAKPSLRLSISLDNR
jgi:hypothetical protein